MEVWLYIESLSACESTLNKDHIRIALEHVGNFIWKCDKIYFKKKHRKENFFVN